MFAGVTQAVTEDAAMRQLPVERGFRLCRKDPGLESVRSSSRSFRPNRICRKVGNSRCQQRRHVANIERVCVECGVGHRGVAGVGWKGQVDRLKSRDFNGEDSRQ